MERFIHDSDLDFLCGMYLNIKNANKGIETNTSKSIKFIIIQKLTNNLYYDYVEIYGDDSNSRKKYFENLTPHIKLQELESRYYLKETTTATDFTTRFEFEKIKNKSKELDLELFFELYPTYEYDVNSEKEEIDYLEYVFEDEFEKEKLYNIYENLLKTYKDVRKNKKF